MQRFRMASLSLSCLTVTLFCCIATNNAASPHERKLELELAEKVLDILEEEKRMNNGNGVSSDITPAELVQEAKEIGEEALRADYELKYRHYFNGIDKHADGTSYDAQTAVAYTDFTPEHAEQLDNATTVATEALIHILDTLDIDLEELLTGKPKYNKEVLAEWRKAFDLQSHRICTDEEKNSAFRPIDGACNNLDHDDWGMSITARERLVPAAFSDKHGLFSPRKADDGRELPSARSVSTKFARFSLSDITPPDDIRTVALTGWGQFTDHELTDTPLSSGFNGAVIECCSLTEAERAERLQCIDIAIPADDETFQGHTCMECVRSSGTFADFGVPGRRHQVNDITAFIDGSSTYGSEDERALELMDSSTGKLVTKRPGFPPEDEDVEACVKNFEDEISYYCPKAGDKRSSDITHLTVYHVLFLRVHNELVEGLEDRNPHWDPKRLYNEARKIVGAILQHITYNEWLPLFIGDNEMKKNKLFPGRRFKYDDSINPSVLVEFATAALRVGHTLVTKSMKRMNSSFDIVEERQNRDAFLDPGLTFKNAPEVMRWMVSTAARKSDRFVNNDFLDALFQNIDPNQPLDLVSLNIQRGRDHGLASYADVHEKCGLGKIEQWSDLIHHTPEVRAALKEAYEGFSVKDIDLFPAGISETITESGAQLGPTFICIFVEQFKRVKFNDRFWYENTKKETNDSKAPFTDEQIAAISKVKLSSLICRHYRLDQIQENAFRIPEPNDRKLCTDLPQLSLDPWEE